MENLCQKRLNRARHLLQEGEALFLVNDADVFYYTGFTGDSSYLLVDHRQCIFITDGRYTAQIEEEAQIELDVREVSVNHTLSHELESIFSEKQYTTVRLDKSQVRLNLYELLMGVWKDSVVLDDDGITRDLRSVKDPFEIEIIYQNLITTELGYNLILPSIEEGMTENEVAARLEFILRENGMKRPAFETIVASGYRSALPHGVASERKITENEHILFDFGVFCNGYASDFTRCFSFGKIIDPKISEIRNIVEAAVHAAEDAVKVGVKASEVHQAAYQVIQNAGYAEYFTHSTGHGVGIEIHEFPRVSATSDVELKEGMVFTIEPGIYLPGLGGIRLEDMVVVSKKGARILTTTDYSL